MTRLESLEEYSTWAKNQFVPVIGPQLYKFWPEKFQSTFEKYIPESQGLAFTAFGITACFCTMAIAFKMSEVRGDKSQDWDYVGSAVSSALTTYLVEKYRGDFENSDWVKINTDWIYGMRAANHGWVNGNPNEKEESVMGGILSALGVPVKNSSLKELATAIESISIWISRVFNEARNIQSG